MKNHGFAAPYAYGAAVRGVDGFGVVVGLQENLDSYHKRGLRYRVHCSSRIDCYFVCQSRHN